MHHAEVMLVGSANIDLVVRSPRFPAPGETLQGTSFQTFAGGKGANQAVAIGRLGGRCGLIGKVGMDAFGDELIDSLRLSGVDTSFILRDATCATGVAAITVDDSGQNTIVVAPGTNRLLTVAEVATALSSTSAKVFLAQLEIPIEVVDAVAGFAREFTFILNPAPAQKLSARLLSLVDYLTPNESEAEVLTGILPVDNESCLRAADVLLDSGVKNVLFTLGKEGSFLANRSGGRHFPSTKVNVVDTTAAGDAFNGAFAHFLSGGEPVERAILFANIAGALCTTKAGAQTAMPTLAEVMSVYSQTA